MEEANKCSKGVNMKFIHAADVHLGNTFTGLSKQMPANLKKLVEESTIMAFQNMIRNAIEEQIDFILLPGDFYNVTKSGPAIQNIVTESFSLLKKNQIGVFLSFGNHDFEVDKQKHLPWPDNVQIFEQNVETKEIILNSGEKIAITGFSYQTPRQNNSVIDKFPKKRLNVDYHIGMYHGSIGNSGEPYAAFKIRDMLDKNYDYWALGHIHARQTLNEVPFIGYSGDLQGLNRKEVGEKGYYLVSPDKSQNLVPHFCKTSIILWQTLSINSLNDESAITEKIKSIKYDNKPVFMTILVDEVHNSVIKERIENGITLETLRKCTPEYIWIVKIIVKNTPLLVNHIDEKYWNQALENVMSEFNINDYLSEQVPITIREFFMTESGQQNLRESMQQLLSHHKEE